MGYTRMMIVEALGDDTAREAVRRMREHTNSLRGVSGDADRPAFPGYRGAVVLQEEDGRLLILETRWSDRDHALNYHASRECRTLTAQVNPFVVGSPVVKVFCNREEDV